MAGCLRSCALLLALFCCLCSAQAGISSTPLYAGTFVGSLHMPLQGLPTSEAVQWITSLSIVTSGNDFNPLTIQVSPSEGKAVGFTMMGSFGCANGKLAAALSGGSPCKANQPQPNGLDLCDSFFPEVCSGTFDYATYLNGNGIYELQINNFCGMKGAVVLQCQGTCTGVVSCASSITQQIIQGGTVDQTGGTIIIQSGGNATVTMTGSPLNIEESNNVTINAGTNLTTYISDGSTAVLNANTTNLYLAPAQSCGGWIYAYGSMSSTANITIADGNAPVAPTVISPTVTTGDGGATWSFNTNRIQYLSTASIAYEISFCVEGGFVTANGTRPERLNVNIANITAGPYTEIGAPGVYTITADVGFSSLSTFCSTIDVGNVYQGNTFQLQLQAFQEDPGSSKPLVLTELGFTFRASPISCVPNNITINNNAITVVNNGVKSITGTPQQIAVNSSSGAVSVSFDPSGILYNQPDPISVQFLANGYSFQLQSTGGTGTSILDANEQNLIQSGEGTMQVKAGSGSDYLITLGPCCGLCLSCFMYWANSTYISLGPSLAPTMWTTSSKFAVTVPATFSSTIFQGANQVIDTITCSNGTVCSKTANAVSITGNYTAGTGISISSSGVISNTGSATGPGFSNNVVFTPSAPTCAGTVLNSYGTAGQRFFNYQTGSGSCSAGVLGTLSIAPQTCPNYLVCSAHVQQAAAGYIPLYVSTLGVQSAQISNSVAFQPSVGLFINALCYCV